MEVLFFQGHARSLKRTPQGFVPSTVTQMVWNSPETCKRAPFGTASRNFAESVVVKFEGVRLFVCPTNLRRLHRLQ